MEEMAISEVTVGTRHRKEMGDLDALMDSIEEFGLLHPIVVTPDGVLVAGMRRLEACRRLCRDTVPVRMVDTDRLVRAEHDENELRKDFTPSERVAIGRALEPKERDAAKKRAARPGQPPPCRWKPVLRSRRLPGIRSCRRRRRGTARRR